MRSHRDSPFNDVFESSILGFENELKTLMSNKKEMPAERVTQQDDIRSFVSSKRDLRVPFFTYRLGDVAINEESVPAERMQRWGRHVGGPKENLDSAGQVVDPNVPYHTENLIPVIVTINVNLYCSQKIQTNFSKMWLALSVRPLVFELVVKDHVHRIKALLEKSITYSDIDGDKDSLTICQTNAMLHTFIVQETQTKPITQYSMRERILDDVTEESSRVTYDETLVYTDEGVQRRS